MFGISFGVMPFGVIGLNAMTRFETHFNGMNPKLSISYGMNASSMLKAAWARVLVYDKIGPFLAMALLKGFDQSCVSWGSFTSETIW